MEVITLTVVGGEDNSSEVSVWDARDAATKYACELICESINRDADLTNVEWLEVVEELDSLINSGAYTEALNYWNDNDTVASTSWCKCYLVESAAVHTMDIVCDPVIEILNQFIKKSPGPSCSDQTVNPLLNLPAGATCRGCGNHNEYVQADKPDGTYVCRGCKGMSEIFKG